MDVKTIAGCVLVMAEIIWANHGCEWGYYYNGTSCVDCSDEAALGSRSRALYLVRCSASCSRGSYGLHCSDRCSKTCKDSICYHWTGKCIYGCKDGWYGESCDKPCSTGCMTNTCYIDGTCARGCQSGYKGRNCVRCPNCAKCSSRYGCDGCQSGYYGDHCQFKCQNCKRTVCHIQTGRCTFGCKTPWSGAECNQKCPSHCKSIHCIAGVCDGCKPGYRGLYCNISCPHYCETCHRHDRKCHVCQQGRYGLLCERTCDNCYENTCDINGNCTLGCKANYYGSKCGKNCSSNCKKTISTSIICSEKSGVCTHGCIDGWYNTTCYKKCNHGCRQGICDRTTGACTAGCFKSFHGTYCNSTCSPNCVDRLCGEDPAGDVMCTRGCVDGWWGLYCQQPCPENCQKCYNAMGSCENCKNHSYGSNCSETCSEGCVGQDCDMTGICRQGCVQGRMDKKCQYSTLWFLSPGLAVVLLAVAVVIWMRKRRCNGTRPDDDFGDRQGTEVVMMMEKRENCTVPTNDINTSQPVIGDDLPLLRAEAFVNPSSVTTRVSLDQFPQYVKQQLRAGGLVKQFQRLPVNPVYACYEGDVSQSARKNRYGNILPYDYNRVVLNQDSAAQSSDYINASYIKGYANEGSFIATQGPYTKVIGDFWTMIWQNEVSKIVMLTNCVESRRMKYEQYWPNLGQTQMITPGIIVECLTEKIDSHFTTRTFTLTKEGHVTRVVKQFHFTTWPDNDVPDNVTSLLNFHMAVTSSTPSVVGPVVVHCSAGVGRTGTYIALNYLIQQAKAEGVIDVFDCVLRLRHQRMNLVQTEEQYLLIHEVFLQAMNFLKHTNGIPVASSDLVVSDEAMV